MTHEVVLHSERIGEQGTDNPPSRLLDIHAPDKSKIWYLYKQYKLSKAFTQV